MNIIRTMIKPNNEYNQNNDQTKEMNILRKMIKPKRRIESEQRSNQRKEYNQNNDQTKEMNVIRTVRVHRCVKYII